MSSSTTKSEPIIRQMERLRGITRAAGDPANTEDGDGGKARHMAASKGPEFMQRKDPFADLDKVEGRMVPRCDMIARAQTAVEQAEKRGVMGGGAAQEATRKAQSSEWISRHMLLYGSDDYVESFRQYLNHPEEISRTPLALATANGGVMLPYQLDPTIILTNDSSANPYRRLARVESVTTNNWHGVSSAGVTAAWLTEASGAGGRLADVRVGGRVPEEGRRVAVRLLRGDRGHVVR